jgi:hypothetical protein
MFLPITGGMVLAGLTIAAFLEFPFLSFMLGICLTWPLVGYPFAFILVVVLAIVLVNVIRELMTSIGNLGPKTPKQIINMYNFKAEKKPKPDKEITFEDRQRAAEEFHRNLQEELAAAQSGHTSHH